MRDSTVSIARPAASRHGTPPHGRRERCRLQWAPLWRRYPDFRSSRLHLTGPTAPSPVSSQRTRQALAVCAVVTVGYLVYRGMYTLNLDGWYASTASRCSTYEIGEVPFSSRCGTPTRSRSRPPRGRHRRRLRPDLQRGRGDPPQNAQACLARTTRTAPSCSTTASDGVRQPAKLGVHYITRDNNLHAKAGNLNHALDQTDGSSSS